MKSLFSKEWYFLHTHIAPPLKIYTCKEPDSKQWQKINIEDERYVWERGETTAHPQEG